MKISLVTVASKSNNCARVKRNRNTEAVDMSVIHKAARENMNRKDTAFDSAFHKAQQVCHDFYSIHRPLKFVIAGSSNPLTNLGLEHIVTSIVCKISSET